MMDQLLAIGLGNTCIALMLAIGAAIVGIRNRRPQLAHLLWLLVLVKLVTPPLWSIPVELAGPVAEFTPPAMSPDDFATASLVLPPGEPTAPCPITWGQIVTWLGVAWLCGSVGVLSWSLRRVVQFERLLRRQTEQASDDVVAAAARLARRLGLKQLPEIRTTTANLSPMVWWVGGRVRVLVPNSLLQNLELRQWRWVLAHELAHVRRGDHWVRWLEWISLVVFWWNPLIWWARRNLRALEEICCDDLVISALDANPHNYANSILNAIEILARPLLRPPAMASQINSGGFLERRFEMIMSNRSHRTGSRLRQGGSLLLAMAILPLGLNWAQDYDAVGKRLKEAVNAGELSDEQARFMLGTLRLTKGLQTKDSDKALSREDFKAAAARIKRAVKNGEVSEKDARTRLDEMHRQLAGTDRPRQAKDEIDWLPIQKRIEGAVRRGDLTRREAERKYKEIKKKMAAGADEAAARLRDVDWEAIQRRIEAAVQRGDMTRAQADGEYKGIKKRLAAEKQRDDANGQTSIDDLGKIVAKLKAAVQAGEVSAADARKKLQAIRQEKAAEREGEQAGKVDSEDSIKRRIAVALDESGIDREKIRKVVGAMERIVGEMQAEGDEFELDPGMDEYLQKLNLTKKQRKLVLGLSQRLAFASEAENRDRNDERSESNDR